MLLTRLFFELLYDIRLETLDIRNTVGHVSAGFNGFTKAQGNASTFRSDVKTGDSHHTQRTERKDNQGCSSPPTETHLLQNRPWTQPNRRLTHKKVPRHGHV